MRSVSGLVGILALIGVAGSISYAFGTARPGHHCEPCPRCEAPGQPPPSAPELDLRAMGLDPHLELR